MNRKVNILGVYFDKMTMEETVKRVLKMMDGNSCRSIFTANPEFVMEATKDEKFKKIVNRGDIITADGIGIIIGSKIIKKPIPERVTGYDLLLNLFNKMKDTDKTVYFFGAEPGIAQKAKETMMKKYPGLKIVGYRNGYYQPEEEEEIIDEINQLQPELLLVGLGMKRQEYFITKYQKDLKVKVVIGIGGCFDVMSGKFKRAPKIFIRLGLEWFHRLITQPSRFVRMLELPKFLVKIIFEGKKYS